MNLKIVFIGLLLCFSLQALSQKKYFYSAIKLPLGEYIANVISPSTDDQRETDGGLIDLGYAVYTKNRFALETGIEYYIINPFQKRYYHDESNFDFEQLSVKNSAFAFQLKPVFKVEIGEKAFFRISNAFNYQQLYSKAEYYVAQSPNNNTKSNTRSAFQFGLQPAMGIDFITNEKLGVGFEIAYVKVNWSRSMNKIHFSNQPNLVVPNHHTSNVFIAFKFIFR